VAWWAGHVPKGRAGAPRAPRQRPPSTARRDRPGQQDQRGETANTATTLAICPGPLRPGQMATMNLRHATRPRAHMNATRTDPHLLDQITDRISNHPRLEQRQRNGRDKPGLQEQPRDPQDHAQEARKRITIHQPTDRQHHPQRPAPPERTRRLHTQDHLQDTAPATTKSPAPRRHRRHPGPAPSRTQPHHIAGKGSRRYVIPYRQRLSHADAKLCAVAAAGKSSVVLSS
jgi:hypothetical protein